MREHDVAETSEEIAEADRATGATGPSGLLSLQRSAGNRAVAAMLARQGLRQGSPRRRSVARREAPAPPPRPRPEMPRAFHRAGATWLARCKCEHDGRRGCGPIAGRFGVEDADTGLAGVFTIDDRIVRQGLTVADPGVWATQVMSPPNPEKDGLERGWIDGLKVQIGDELVADVVEVKSRRTGGCCLASREADGYVRVLTRIAPQIQRVSELATADGQGVRALPGTTPAQLTTMLRTAGIDLGSPDMASAWAFYNSLQNRLGTTFKKAFKAVRFRVATGGVADATYFIQPPTLIRCKDKDGEFWGIERLVFQVNQKGGVSYGCIPTCKRQRKHAKEEDEAIAAYERRTGADPAAIKAVAGETVTEQEAQEDGKLRPAAITGLVPELQVKGIGDALRVGVAREFGSEPPGRRFYLLASQQLVTEFIGKPRALRTANMLKVPASPAFGLGALSGQVLYWFYGVPMSIAIIILAPMLGEAAAVPAEGGVAGGAVVMAEGLTMTTLEGLAGAAANDNAIKVASMAAGVILTLVVARTAEAGEPYKLEERHSIEAVPVETVGGRLAGIGDEVDYGGFRRVVVGTAQVP